jgi:hypothetical protein
MTAFVWKDREGNVGSQSRLVSVGGESRTENFLIQVANAPA